MKQRIGHVYKIVQESSPHALYVGSTVAKLKTRWRGHIRDSLRYNSKLGVHLRKHGFDKFHMITITDVEFTDFGDLRQVEENYRRQLNPPLNSQVCHTGMSRKEYLKKYHREYYRRKKMKSTA